MSFYYAQPASVDILASLMRHKNYDTQELWWWDTGTMTPKNYGESNIYMLKNKHFGRDAMAAQKMKFSIKDFFSKCAKSAVSCGFGHIYWRNP